MKKTLIAILMLTLVSTSVFAALNDGQSYMLNNYLPYFDNIAPKSFSSISTYGLFLDDLDFMVNPGKITFIKGNRLYTNLSNLINGNETQFTGIGLGDYAIGTKFDVKSISPVFLYSTNRNESTTGVNSASKTYYDNDNNGYYDQINFYQNDTYNSSTNQNKTAYLGFGKQMDNINIGLLYEYVKNNGFSMPTIDPLYANFGNYTNTERDSNLVSGDLIYTEDQFATDTIWNNDSHHRLLLGGFDKLSDKLKVGLIAKVGYSILKPVTNASYSDNIDQSPWNQGFTDISVETDSLYKNMKISGLGYSFTFITYYMINKNIRSQIDLGYSAFGGTIADSSTGYRYFNSYTEHTMANGTFYDGQDTTETGMISGSKNQKAIHINSKAIIKMNDNFNFGIGIGFNNKTVSNIEHNNYNYTAVDTFDDGDGIQTGMDYVSTATYSALSSNETVASNYMLSLPVAIVFNLNKMFKARIGANYTYKVQNSTNTVAIDSITPINVHTVYGDGTVANSIIPSPNNINDGTVTNTVSRTSTTTYNYSLAYSPNKNLTLEIMGFAPNLINLTLWKLQAVINF